MAYSHSFISTGCLSIIEKSPKSLFTFHDKRRSIIYFSYRLEKSKPLPASPALPIMWQTPQNKINYDIQDKSWLVGWMGLEEMMFANTDRVWPKYKGKKILRTWTVREGWQKKCFLKNLLWEFKILKMKWITYESISHFNGQATTQKSTSAYF